MAPTLYLARRSVTVLSMTTGMNVVSFCFVTEIGSHYGKTLAVLLDHVYIKIYEAQGEIIRIAQKLCIYEQKCYSESAGQLFSCK
jgi:hypothetical protein